MKKYLISLSVIFIFVINLAFAGFTSLSGTGNAMAQDAAVTTKTDAEKSCEDKIPAFTEKNVNSQFTVLAVLQSEINAGKTVFDYAKFTETFESAQSQYHEYANCIFSYAEKEILGNVGLSTGTIQANTPDIDWMDPKASCLSSGKLKEIKKKTGSDELLRVLLGMYSTYSDFLDSLAIFYKTNGRETGAGVDKLSQTELAYADVNRQAGIEKENALVAMDMAFKSLKELRLAFFMHVQFQCMMNNLEKYRKWLESIRIIVDSIPDRLRDCSMTK
jgi:hypothetical protein